jgi:hypothetical protein
MVDKNFFSPLSFVAVFGSGIRHPGSVMGKNQDPGSGINIPDPPHCYPLCHLMPNTSRETLSQKRLRKGISSSPSLFNKCCDHSVLDRKNSVAIRNRILRNPRHCDKPNLDQYQNNNQYRADIICLEIHNIISGSHMLSANYTVQYS